MKSVSSKWIFFALFSTFSTHEGQSVTLPFHESKNNEKSNENKSFKFKMKHNIYLFSPGKHFTNERRIFFIIYFILLYIALLSSFSFSLSILSILTQLMWKFTLTLLNYDTCLSLKMANNYSLLSQCLQVGKMLRWKIIKWVTWYFSLLLTLSHLFH